MITQYHRPATLDEAVALVGTPGAIVIAEGMARSTTTEPAPLVVIDLQSLDLGGIEVEGETMRIGSMTTLSDLSTSPLTPVVIADLARREAPSTIRNAATIGGTIATNDPESELLAGLVAFNASVAVVRADSIDTYPLEDVLKSPKLIERSIITGVSMHMRGPAAAHRTGRTPMDRPIVMVAGHMSTAGHIRLGVTGVATHVVVISPGQAGELDPPSDFRGTSQYRKSLATVLTKRVLHDLQYGGRP